MTVLYSALFSNLHLILVTYPAFKKFLSSDILLQIDKKEFLASGDVIHYMNWLPTGQIYNIYVSKQVYMSAYEIGVWLDIAHKVG